MAISNNKISHLVSSQLPFFVRNDHGNFTAFLEAYYEFLEQDDEVVNRIKNVQTYYDIDRTIDEFTDDLYATFTKLIPEDILADRKLLLKHVKDFYRAKGTEKSVRFLMRILFNEEIDFYYPKKDVLRVSDGKWFIQKSLRINSTLLNDVSDDTLATLERYIGTRITGSTSEATAIIERVDRFFEQGFQIDELILSNINGDFESGEQITTMFDDENGVTQDLESTIISGILNTVEIINGGANYIIGDPVIVVSSTGAGACVTVSAVSTGNIFSLDIVESGAGYRSADVILITGGGGGTGANANVFSVTADNTAHPNIYSIASSTISLEANTAVGNAVYTNLSATNVASWIANAMNFWSYSNTGPVESVLVISSGSGYTTNPSFSVVANSQIINLGILGKMEIIDGGTEYRIGNKIEFVNPWGSYGSGALANVTNVDINNSNTITEVRFAQMNGHLIGGSGYNQDILPTVNISTSTGSGANVIVKTLLGYGGQFAASNSSIGRIERVIILNRGSGYLTTPTIDLTGSGDGSATANATVITGTYSYPGRYLNDDGHLSSYNFLQDRDYYQSFSYVVKIRKSIDLYRQVLKELTHPAGTKLFGEYTLVDENADVSAPENTVSSDTIIYKLRTYTKNTNTVNISYTSHAFVANDNVYLEFLSGGYANVQNGIYMIDTASGNNFIVTMYVSGGANTSGNVEVGTITS